MDKHAESETAQEKNPEPSFHAATPDAGTATDVDRFAGILTGFASIGTAVVAIRGDHPYWTLWLLCLTACCGCTSAIAYFYERSFSWLPSFVRSRPWRSSVVVSAILIMATAARHYTWEKSAIYPYLIAGDGETPPLLLSIRFL